MPSTTTPELPLPTEGGCYIRNPDGTLSPDPAPDLGEATQPQEE